MSTPFDFHRAGWIAITPDEARALINAANATAVVLPNGKKYIARQMLSEKLNSRAVVRDICFGANAGTWWVPPP